MDRILIPHRVPCLQIAEVLYQKGFISYPRTETRTSLWIYGNDYLSADSSWIAEIFDETMDLPALVSQHTNHPDWGNFAKGEAVTTFLWPL
jgi:DNA topoisomerase IA